MSYIENTNYKKFINLTLNGGLGNQIFQYLAAKYIQDKLEFNSIFYSHNYFKEISLDEFIFDSGLINAKSKFQSNKFQKPIKYITKIKNFLNKLNIFFQSKNFILNSNKIYVREFYPFSKDRFFLDDRILFCQKIIKKNKNSSYIIEMSGFWQNPISYLNQIDHISNSFKSKIIIKNNLLFKPSSYISIHARRGDYINNLNTAREYYSNHSLLTYLDTSLKILPSEFESYPIILVSDDIDWFKKIELNNLLKTNKEIIYFSSNEFEEWNLLNNSRLNIISNSTFSYTASLLNNVNTDSKLRTIMPFWFNRNETTYSKGWQELDGFIGI